MTTEIKENQVWVCRGKKAKWTVWFVDGKRISLTRDDILNPGTRGARFEKSISKEKLLRKYRRLN